MAITVTYTKKRKNADGTTSQLGQVTFDSSYPTGGEAVTGWDASNVKRVNFTPTATHFALYDAVAKKIAVWTSGAEVANLTDISTLKLPFEVVTI